MSIRKTLFSAALALAAAFGASAAHAGDVHWSVGVSLPHVDTVVSNVPHRPTHVYHAPPPVYYPPPVVVHRPPQVVYAPPPVVYQPYPGRYGRHHHWQGPRHAHWHRSHHGHGRHHDHDGRGDREWSRDDGRRGDGHRR